MIWENLFLVYLLLTPFIVWGGFEGPKVFYLFIGAIVLCIFHLITLGRKLIASLNSSGLFYGLFLLILAISSFLGVHPLESIVGGSYRHQGVIFFFAIWLIGKTISTLSKKSKVRLTKIVIAWVLIESLLVFIQNIFSVNVTFGRAIGSLGEPNAVAGMLAVSLSFVNGLPIVLVGLLAIILLNSRSGFLSFLPLVLFKFKKIQKKFFLCLITLVPIGLLIFLVASETRGVSYFENRGLITKVAVDLISKKPFLGYGAESGEVIYDTYFRNIGIPIVGVIIDRSHNIILDVLLWTGITGLIPFLGWFYLNVKRLSLAKKWDRITGVVSFLIYSFLQPLGVIHWLLLVILFEL